MFHSVVIAAVIAAASLAADPPSPVTTPAPPTGGTAVAPNPPPPSVAPAGPHGQLQGAAQIRRNLPVVGAVVKVTRSDAPSELRITSTDAHGAFRLDGLADGRYALEFAHDGFATVIKDGVELRAPFRAVVEVTMVNTEPGPVAPPAPRAASGASAAPVALRGVVRDKDGHGSGEIKVSLIRADGSEDPRQAVTSASGEFAFDAITPGGWNLEMHGAGLLPVRTPVVLAEATTIAAVLVAQPADYPPAIEDLMPNEEPIPPPEAVAVR